jgi:hypothetical protein
MKDIPRGRIRFKVEKVGSNPILPKRFLSESTKKSKYLKTASVIKFNETMNTNKRFLAFPTLLSNNRTM